LEHLIWIIQMEGAWTTKDPVVKDSIILIVSNIRETILELEVTPAL
jgi:hypothetical protein